MTSLELNIAKNIIEDMSEEEKSYFLNEMNGEQRIAYSVQAAKEQVQKRHEMSTQLILNGSKMDQFGHLVAGLI